MNKFFGAAIIFLALLIAIVPAFTDCQSQGRSLTTKDGKTVAMKCHWAGIAEIGAAVPLALTGIFNMRKQRKATTRMLASFGMVAGAFAILFPTVLIGVCANPDMLCNMILKPTMIGAGILAIVFSIALFITGRDPVETTE
jgi:hypothetical protein